jgi:hypothetical protein
MIVKRKYIANLSKKFNIKILIETGTYFGQSTKYFSKNFDQVYTIELSQKLYNFVRKINSRVNIKFYQGDSSEILKLIVKELPLKSTFFLDAHASGGVTVYGETVSPVKIELGILANFPYLKESLLILDDARGFDGTNSYPTIKEIKDWAKELNLGKVYKVLDMIIIEPISN